MSIRFQDIDQTTFIVDDLEFLAIKADRSAQEIVIEPLVAEGTEITLTLPEAQELYRKLQAMLVNMGFE